MSTIDELRVNPFVTKKLELKIKARFPCPHCAEPVEVIFTGPEIESMYKGYLEALKKGAPRG